MYIINIVIKPDALKDLDEIERYIKRDSKFYAEKTIIEINDKIENLKYFPYLGRYVPEFNSKNYRELIYKSYRIIYLFDSNNIYIVRVMHHSRNISQLKPK